MDIMIWIFALLFLVGGYMLYLYASYHELGCQGVKAFLKPKYNLKALVYSIGVCVLGTGTLIFGMIKYDNSMAISCFYVVTIIMLAAMAWIDYKFKIIPNKLIVAGLICWIIEQAIIVYGFNNKWSEVLPAAFLGGFLWGGIFVVIALISKASLGMGDAKMFFVLGLMNGMNDTYCILLISMLIMAVTSIVLLLLKKVDRKTHVPMAPFVLIGFLVCIFIGI